MAAQSIPELTNYEYNELKYNSASLMITGTFMKTVCEMLNKCNPKNKVSYSNTYDDTIENAVRQFQQSSKIKANGILDTYTWQAMLIAAKQMSDSVEDDSVKENEEESESSSPHFQSFFNKDNYKPYRKNYQDIKIIFGNNSITKTLRNVIMRSVTLEVDTSGNPISEIYEFIAQDVIESDEINDADNYTTDEHFTSIDTQYNFNRVFK